MATIQVREIPPATYEVLRARATADGKSLQAYMRDVLVELAARPTKTEAIATIKAALERYGGANSTPEQILADIKADRR